ncbi:DUF6924 domain-containing protein [Amycolatopsis rhizosphaerae]|uniref:DUF6924 domain-containing protein n=1 Tax=Amycolatopsis rhizosphaerae TaxID=2053003 RepID=UPI0016438341|nr:hypothetical protein [Amycolatopsis rhizosphaerae]
MPAADQQNPLVRTDFSDDETWEALCTAVATPTEEDFLACVRFVDDPASVT